MRRHGDTATLVVEDDGVGRDSGRPPTGTGLGTQIVAAMASNLGSEVVFDGKHAGTSARLAFPI
jgi:two-component sensor histidine kinase